MIKKYRKLPIEIEAIKLERNRDSIVESWKFMDGDTHLGDVTEILEEEADEVLFNNQYKGLEIITLEGEMLAFWGDYIIKGVNGEFYPCKPDIFRKTYEEVGE